MTGPSVNFRDVVHFAPEHFVPPTTLTSADFQALATAPLSAKVLISYGVEMPMLQVGPWRLKYYNWTELRGQVEGSSYENNKLTVLASNDAKKLFCMCLSRLDPNNRVYLLAKEDHVEVIAWA